MFETRTLGVLWLRTSSHPMTRLGAVVSRFVPSGEERESAPLNAETMRLRRRSPHIGAQGHDLQRNARRPVAKPQRALPIAPPKALVRTGGSDSLVNRVVF